MSMGGESEFVCSQMQVCKTCFNDRIRPQLSENSGRSHAAGWISDAVNCSEQ